MKGHYLNWHQQSLFIPQSHKWYRVCELIDYLHKSSEYIKNNGRTKIPNLSSYNIPITENYRFPAHSSYICEGIGDWNLHLDLLIYSLNILKGSKSMKESTFTTIGQVEMFALEKINILLQCLTETTNILTRQKIEEKYHLIWLETFTFVNCQNVPVVFVGVLQYLDKLWQYVTQND